MWKFLVLTTMEIHYCCTTLVVLEVRYQALCVGYEIALTTSTTGADTPGLTRSSPGGSRACIALYIFQYRGIPGAALLCGGASRHTAMQPYAVLAACCRGRVRALRRVGLGSGGGAAPLLLRAHPHVRI
jgi:hypothetical protein